MKRREKESSGIELSTLCRQLMIEAVAERIERYGNENRGI